jgi:hypothetical protein
MSLWFLRNFSSIAFLRLSSAFLRPFVGVVGQDFCK